MMKTVTYIELPQEIFDYKEKILVRHEQFIVLVFRFSSGVPALRLCNSRGQIVWLPYQGQQIWSAAFDGRDLTMKSMFTEPRHTQIYLETYGGFLIHCGATAMGVPTQADSHPLHGELPNACYRQAYLMIGEDNLGSYIGLGGEYQHTMAFSTNYLAEPMIKLHSDSSLLYIELKLINLKNSEMELMYLAHINFRPAQDGRLVYTALCTPKTVRVRTSIPSHIHPQPGYREFLEVLKEHPEVHHHLTSDLMFDPEVVFMIDYQADADGWAHSMQIHPDGSADYVAHRPNQLDHGIRWICRTVDQDALGIALPATAEPEGYLAEKAKGNIKTIPPKGQFTCEMIAGGLSPSEAREMELKIKALIA